MKALVLGAGGQLGSDLLRVLPSAHGFSRLELSVTDRRALEAALEAVRPDVVFNCAAYNAVDRAESEPELAFQVNSEGAFNVAAACSGAAVRLVHFSTNFVFDGTLQRPYRESDAPGPLGAYGRSKLEGEGRVLAEYPQSLVVRTAALYGDRGSAVKGGSFPERIVNQAATGGPLRVVGDQLVNPTYTLDLARAFIDLKALPDRGVLHLVAEGCCGWDEFARAALAACGITADVQAVSSDAFPGAARRPPNGCLESELVGPLRPWRDGLREWASSRQAAKGG